MYIFSVYTYIACINYTQYTMLATDLCPSWPKVLNLERGRALGCPSYIQCTCRLTHVQRKEKLIFSHEHLYWLVSPMYGHYFLNYTTYYRLYIFLGYL